MVSDPRSAGSPHRTATFLRSRLYTNLAWYCAAAIALIGISVWLWFGTGEGSFPHDALAPTLMGSAVTALAAFASLAVLATREIQERQQLNVVERVPRQARPTLRLGNLVVEDIRVVAAGTGLERRSRFEVVAPSSDTLPRREDPPEWPALERVVIPRLRQRAQQRRQVLFDDEKLDLLDAVRRRELVDGHPVVVHELHVGSTTYLRFAAMSNALDEDVRDVLPGIATLRGHWAMEPMGLEHVANLPAPAALGCEVVVVTADDQIVLLERAATYIGGPLPGDRRTPVHVVAEGMIPGDVESGQPPLRAAALRALDEELGIDVDCPGLEPLMGLEMVGVFFDTRRWQPCFVWLAQLSISLDELSTMHSVARDGWESASIYGVPYDIRAESTRALLLGRHQHLVAATNHARAALALALMARDGLVLCRAALSWGVGRGRRSFGPGTGPCESMPATQSLTDEPQTSRPSSRSLRST